MGDWPSPYAGAMGPQRGSPAVGAPQPLVRSFQQRLGRRAATTVHVAAYPLGAFVPRVVALDPPQRLAAWCQEAEETEAIVGGFFVRPGGRPLGELWVGGKRLASEPFLEPWAGLRSCLQIDGDVVAMAPRWRLPTRPRGHLLQVGPLLVARGKPVVGRDPEGFSAGAAQFDSDITLGRYPRAALGLHGNTLLAVVCDGRSEADAGMTLRELARFMARLGADSAINLDGGGSTSLVSGGALVNTPREEHGIELLGGRPVSTVLVFSRRG